MWKKGSAKDYEELIVQIIDWMTNRFIHGDRAWELMRHEPWPKGTILKVKGLKGKDHFYIGLMPLDISVNSTYRNWFWQKQNIATNFVWSEKGINKKVPFIINGNTIILDKIRNGMKPYSSETGGGDIWSKLLEKLKGSEEDKDKVSDEEQKKADEVLAELVQGKPRSFKDNHLVIVFNEAYPKQRTEKSTHQAIIKETIKKIFDDMLENEEIEELPEEELVIECILESPYIPYEKPDTYRFATMDIFSNAAKVLYFGVFKQYAEELDWHEQAGGMDFPNLPLMTLEYYYNTSSTSTYWNPPTFPCAGYPAIGMDYSGAISGKLDYYLIKNKCGMTLVVNNKEKTPDGAANWETVFTGLFEPYADYEYPLPAAVVGGTSGLTMKGETRYYDRPVTGMRFDYRPKNWSLIHGIVPFSSAGLDSPYCPTQAAVCLPEGTWKHFANYVQGVEVLRWSDNGGDSYYAYPTSPPQRPRNIRAFIRPADSDLYEYYNIYDGDVDENKRKSGYKLEPIEFYEYGAGDGHHILGRLPEFYHASRPIYRYGETVVSGKRYLILPNVWEGRKFHLPYVNYYTSVFDPNTLLTEDQKRDLRNKKMEGLVNLFIKLEE